jgi:acetate---CoA ligase (ADP-forming)
MSDKLRALFEARSVVVVGASNDPVRIGGRPFELLRSHGFAGEVFGVNPKYETVFGYPCFPDIASLPGEIDMVVVAVGAGAVLDVLRQAHEKGASSAIIFTSGFADMANEEGIGRQEDLKRFCHETGMLVVGPNTLGMAVPRRGLVPTFASSFLPDESETRVGGAAVIAQGGGPFMVIHNGLRERGVGLSFAVATGNEAGLAVEDFLAHAAGDETSDTAICYLEGVVDGRAFVEALIAMRDAEKPAIIFKAGRTQSGAAAAASHTAKIVGDHRSFLVGARQAGAIVSDTVEELADIGYMARFRERGMGRRVAVVTTSGAFGAILTDQFSDAGQRLAEFDPELADSLQALLPSFMHAANPLDLSANVVNDQAKFAGILDLLEGSEGCDLIAIFSTGNLVERLTPLLIAHARQSRKLVTVMHTGTCRTTEDLDSAGVPVFTDTDRGCRAVAAMSIWREGLAGDRWYPARLDEPASGANAGCGAILDEGQAREALVLAGVPFAERAIVAQAETAALKAAELGFPVVLKVQAEGLVHKTELGGVVTGLADGEAVKQCFRRMAEIAAPLGGTVFIEKQAGPGFELLVCVSSDPIFGHCLTVGQGGIATEIAADTAQLILPASRAAIETAMRSLRCFPLLEGYRGGNKRDLDAALDAIEAVCAYADTAGSSLDFLEINPLIVMEDGVVAVDCLLRTR